MQCCLRGLFVGVECGWCGGGRCVALEVTQSHVCDCRVVKCAPEFAGGHGGDALGGEVHHAGQWREGLDGGGAGMAVVRTHLLADVAAAHLSV